MKCFVIMPFGNPKIGARQARELDLIYTHWIKPTVESIELPNRKGQYLYCHRVDEELRSGDIVSDIIENLVAADVVVADLSGRNANVFYELGVRHATHNNTILIAQNLDDIPFDLRGLRTIPYEYEPERMLAFRDQLRDSILDILAGDQRIDNPVRKYLYEREVEKLVVSAVPPGYDAITSMASEIASLRRVLTEQVNELRGIIEQVAAGEPATGRQPDKGEFSVFEGAWRQLPSGSMLYARVVNGRLLVPYCYGGNSALTAHYYDCRRFGDALFARFEWFDAQVSGYGYYKIASKDKLVGGWWYSRDAPKTVLREPCHIDELLSVPEMRRSTIIRERGAKRFPAWAEEYFARAGKQEKDTTQSAS